jgi:hypothetical protein
MARVTEGTLNIFAYGTIRAELIGENECRAGSIVVRSSNAPILLICRKLVEAGVDPSQRLHAYRGDVLCVAIRSIGEGAKTTVKDRPHGPVFEKWRPLSTPPVAQPSRFEGAVAITLPKAA